MECANNESPAYIKTKRGIISKSDLENEKWSTEDPSDIFIHIRIYVFQEQIRRFSL